MKVTSNQAIAATLAGDWENAIKLNKFLLEEKPNDVEALNRMGLAYSVLGNSKNAKESFEKVLEIDPLNSIALKNIKKLKTESKNNSDDVTFIQVNNIFIEEHGKTKVVELINLAQAEILQSLQTGQSVDMNVKRLKIFVLQGKKYIGVLPDDIGNRLIRFIKGGNKYEAFVKSASHQNVSIFIRELKRSSKFKDQPSFIHSIEKKLHIKNDKSKNHKEDLDSDTSEE
jgi:tetratricopeptide (TPR) repeat protein